MRSPKYLTIALSLAALMVLVAAGCGGGGGSDSTAATEPRRSRAEAEQSGTDHPGRRDLRRGQRRRRLGRRLGRQHPEPDRTGGDLYTGMVSSINELGTPKEDRPNTPNSAAAGEELAKIEGEVKLAAEREDTATIGELASEAAPALENFQTTAAVYGFEECSQGPSAPSPRPPPAAEGEEEGGVEAPEIEEVAPKKKRSKKWRRKPKGAAAPGRSKKSRLKKAAARNPVAGA